MPNHLSPPQQLQRKRSLSNLTRQTISQAQHEFNYSRYSAVQSLKAAVHKLSTLVNNNNNSNTNLQNSDLDEIRSYFGTRPSTAHTSPQTTPALSILEPDEYDSDSSTIHTCDQVQVATSGLLIRDSSCACGRVLPCWVHA